MDQITGNARCWNRSVRSIFAMTILGRAISGLMFLLIPVVSFAPELHAELFNTLEIDNQTRPIEVEAYPGHQVYFRAKVSTECKTTLSPTGKGLKATTLKFKATSRADLGHDFSGSGVDLLTLRSGHLVGSVALPSIECDANHTNGFSMPGTE